MAAGIAAEGYETIFSDLFNIFQRAYDQVLHDICRQNLNVVIGIDRAGLLEQMEKHIKVYLIFHFYVIFQIWSL